MKCLAVATPVTRCKDMEITEQSAASDQFYKQRRGGNIHLILCRGTIVTLNIRRQEVDIINYFIKVELRAHLHISTDTQSPFTLAVGKNETWRPRVAEILTLRSIEDIDHLGSRIHILGKTINSHRRTLYTSPTLRIGSKRSCSKKQQHS